MRIAIPLVIIISLLNLFNATPSREFVVAGSKYEDAEYMNLFKLPNTLFTYSANGGERQNNKLEYAFDGNWNNNCWISGVENSASFTAEVTINFKQTVSLASMLYQCQNYYTQGYPKIIAFKYKLNGESQYKEIKYESPDDTNQKVVFHFGEAVKCDELIIRWDSITKNKLTNIATAREIAFVQSETELTAKSLKMFNYNYLELTQEFNSEAKINQLEEEGKKNPNYDVTLKDKIARARAILSGAYRKDKRREFTTDENNKDATYIRQNGNIHDYTQNVLKMAWIGLDRQPTGIYGRGGEEMIVYADGLESDPLPNIIGVQTKGHYSDWSFTAPKLKLGKNVFTFKNFNTAGYADKVPAGGPMYIANLYTKEQQSSNVKIYFENGVIFPVFRKGDDVTKFVRFLEDYVKYYKNLESQGYFDVVEFYGDRTLITVDADRARLKYTLLEGENPQTNLENWDAFLLKLLLFDGVQIDPSQPYYDPRAIHIGCNYRYSQKFGMAYAGYDHVGIFLVDWLDVVIFGDGYGWGMAHEIGHEMESNCRGYGECTNNMIAKYYEDAVIRSSSNGHWEESLIYLTPDDVDPMQRCEVEGVKGSFWKCIGLNYLVWWHIENYFHGYWGNFDNIFRYQQVNETGLTVPEKHVLYSSLAVGYDLSYYFDRWGYNFNNDNNPIFDSKTATDVFKNYMKQFIDAGKIRNDKQFKLWYLDRKEYNFIVDNGLIGCDYSTSHKISPVTIVKVNETAYQVVMPSSNCKAHLGYEIYINGQLKNFTYGTSFTVNNVNAQTTFSIAAYDRKLDHTAVSDPLRFTDIKATPFCKIGSTQYSTLQDAFNAVNDNQVIEIFKDVLVTSTATFNKNINIKITNSIDDSVHIYKTFAGNLMEIQQGSVTIMGKSDTNRIIFDSSVAINGRLIVVQNSAKLTAKYITLQNIQTTQRGGAIHLEGNAFIDLSYSLFYNCKADYGGGLELSSNQNKGIVQNVKFTSNSCTNFGGAIRNAGSLTVQNCEFTEALGNCKYGSAISDDSNGSIDIISSTFKNNKGNNGIIYVDGPTRINGCTFTENSANQGTVIYENTGRGLVLYIFGNTKIYNNYAKNRGAFLYLNKGQASIYGGEIHDNTVINDPDQTNTANSIYVNKASSIHLNSGCKINGNLYLEATGLLLANSSMPLPYNNQKLAISFPIVEGDLSVIKGENMSLTNEELKKINLITDIGGNLRIDGNTALFTLGKCQAKIKIMLADDLYYEETTELVKCGSEFEIMEYLFIVEDWDSYLDYVRDDRGREYEENPILDFNLTFTLQYSYFRTATVNYVDGSYTEDIYDGFKFCLPSYRAGQTCNANNNYEIYAYSDEEGNLYDPGECFIVNKDLTFFAKYNKFLQITLMVDGEFVPGKLVDAGYVYELPKTIDGTNIAYWYANDGTKYQAGKTVEIKRDTTFSNTQMIGHHGLETMEKPESKNNTIEIIAIASCVIFVIAALGLYFMRRQKKLEQAANLMA